MVTGCRLHDAFYEPWCDYSLQEANKEGPKPVLLPVSALVRCLDLHHHGLPGCLPPPLLPLQVRTIVFSLLQLVFAGWARTRGVWPVGTLRPSTWLTAPAWGWQGESPSPLGFMLKSIHLNASLALYSLCLYDVRRCLRCISTCHSDIIQSSKEISKLFLVGQSLCWDYQWYKLGTLLTLTTHFTF